MFCLLDWQIETPHGLLISEGKFSIISLTTIVSPPQGDQGVLAAGDDTSTLVKISVLCSDFGDQW